MTRRARDHTSARVVRRAPSAFGQWCGARVLREALHESPPPPPSSGTAAVLTLVAFNSLFLETWISAPPPCGTQRISTTLRVIKSKTAAQRGAATEQLQTHASGRRCVHGCPADWATTHFMILLSAGAFSAGALDGRRPPAGPPPSCFAASITVTLSAMCAFAVAARRAPDHHPHRRGESPSPLYQRTTARVATRWYPIWKSR